MVAPLTEAEKKNKAVKDEKDAKAVLAARDVLIKKTYYDGAGYNSLAITLRDVRKKERQHDKQ